MDALPYPLGLNAADLTAIGLYTAVAASYAWLGFDFLRRLKQPRAGALRRFPFDGLSKWVVWGWLALSIGGLLLHLPPTTIFWIAIVAPLTVVSILGEIAFARRIRTSRQPQAAFSSSPEGSKSPCEKEVLSTP
jgi:hypothetical protein